MKQDFFNEEFPTFLNYKQEMWQGEVPAGNGHQHINGGYCDRWVTKYGGGESYNGEIINADFRVNAKITIYIVGDSLWISDMRYAGKNDIWEYSNNGHLKSPTGLLNECHRHELEPDKIEKILNMDFNCKFWDMVKTKAKQLYNNL